MDKQFDELSKSLVEGVSRRDVLRKLGVGLAGVVLACLGIGGGRLASAQGSYSTCCHYVCFGCQNHKGYINAWVCEPPGTACPAPSLICPNYGCYGGGGDDWWSVTSCKDCNRTK